MNRGDSMPRVLHLGGGCHDIRHQPFVGGEVSNYAQSWVWDYSRSSGLNRFVFLAIARFYNETKQKAWPSVESIAEICGVSISTVRRSLAALEELGELKVISRVGESGINETNCYEMPIAQAWIDQIIKEGRKYRGGYPTDRVGYPIEPQEAIPQIPKVFSTSNSIEEKEVLPLNREERKAIPKPEKKVKERKYTHTNYALKITVPKSEVKQPEAFIEFCRLFSYYAEVNAVTHPRLWELPGQIAEEIGWENLESRLEVYIDRLDKATGYAAKDFLDGGWQTVTGKEYEMKKLDGKF